jgi:hypothetical protein
VVRQGRPSLDEAGQIAELAVFHAKVDFIGGALAVEEGDDVGVVQVAEDAHLGFEVVLQFLGELLDVDGLDGYDGAGFLLYIPYSLALVLPRSYCPAPVKT